MRAMELTISAVGLRDPTLGAPRRRALDGTGCDTQRHGVRGVGDGLEQRVRDVGAAQGSQCSVIRRGKAGRETRRAEAALTSP